VKRKDLQVLAETRLTEAQVLFQNRKFDGAYYLAGYAIECAIKACVARNTRRFDFPDKDLANQVYTHDLTKLLTPAGLAQIFKDEFRGNPALEVRWGVVKDWSEQSRYETHSRKKANDIIDAVGHPQGILACIRKYW
jgi:HEPN domain-containing protein